MDDFKQWIQKASRYPDFAEYNIFTKEQAYEAYDGAKRIVSFVQNLITHTSYTESPQ